MEIGRLKWAVESVVERYRENGYFPDACVRVFDRNRSLVTVCAGRAQEDSLFDVASLTKIATAAQILRLADQGVFRLEDRIAALMPQLKRHPFLEDRMQSITLYMLLTHTSTLPAWYPFYAMGQDDFYEALSEVLMHEKPTQSVVYSDLNFMLLGKLLEQVRNKPLEVCLQEDLVSPLGLGEMMYRPSVQESIIPSDYGNLIEMRMCRDRGIAFQGFRPVGVPAPGTVNDGNCHYYFHDVSGHAGIFATTESYMRLCQYFMNASSPLMKEAQKEMPSAPGRGLGFQTGLTYPNGCGHTGFTGTSLYFSSEFQIGCIAFTNRLFFREENHHDLSEFRRALHEAVFAAGAEVPEGSPMEKAAESDED